MNSTLAGTRRQRRRGAGWVAAIVVAVHMAAAPIAASAADAFEVMRDWGGFETFCRLIERAGLVDAFRAGGPITVFAPTNAAFERLEPGVLEALGAPANLERLRATLRYHVVPERLRVFELRREEPRATVHGKTVRSLLMGNAMMVNDAFIDFEDIAADNGVVHAIDKVLAPPS